jgi:hypothetical protein
MGMGMDGFRSGSGPKQFGDLRVALGLGFGSESEILAVSLALTGEGSLKVVLGGHCQLPFWFDLFAVSYINEASSPIHQVLAGGLLVFYLARLDCTSRAEGHHPVVLTAKGNES